jgi:uncharacterized RDD family membrane protein YckC
MEDKLVIDSDEMIKADIHPGLFKRIQASAIDGGILLLVFILSFNIIDFIGDAPGYVRGGILLFMFFLYEPLLVSFWGGTIGHHMMKLRVRDEKMASKNIALPLSFIRTFVKGLFGFVSFFTMGFNSRKRTLHDMASLSVMIEIK